MVSSLISIIIFFNVLRKSIEKREKGGKMFQKCSNVPRKRP
jgi:hypothetical protein